MDQQYTMPSLTLTQREEKTWLHFVEVDGMQEAIFYSEWSDKLKSSIEALDLSNVSQQFIFISTIMKSKEEKIRWAIVIDELNMDELNAKMED